MRFVDLVQLTVVLSDLVVALVDEQESHANDPTWVEMRNDVKSRTDTIYQALSGEDRSEEATA
jgi:hypothetical protein